MYHLLDACNALTPRAYDQKAYGGINLDWSKTYGCAGFSILYAAKFSLSKAFAYLLDLLKHPVMYSCRGRKMRQHTIALQMQTKEELT